MKYLIVNADDFGISKGVNRGIIEAAELGIVTSTSLMVRQPGAANAAALARARKKLSVGLHLDLGEWVYRQGEWVRLYSVVQVDDARQVEIEISHQLQQFQRLMGRDPSHIDSHQHVHREEPIHSIVKALGANLGVPVRDVGERIIYCGDFYGQTGEGESWPEGISVEGLKSILSRLTGKITELGCHPGYDDGLQTAYRSERAHEVKVLCDPEIRRTAAELGFEFCSFDRLPREQRSAGQVSLDQDQPV
ncbi:MAG TPA: ChbG/HpnK family deacetylase [Candidatus Limnocylindrales bacterium]|nr:ChbG/HpnK family deacetylase [Candidatus Limnocylindrales bacterium]